MVQNKIQGQKSNIILSANYYYFSPPPKKKFTLYNLCVCVLFFLIARFFPFIVSDPGYGSVAGGGASRSCQGQTLGALVLVSLASAILRHTL